MRNKHTVTTLYKYFISYFLLLTILTLGYTAAFRVQLKKVYTKELHNQAEKQLVDIDDDLYSSISTIEKIQYLLAQDIPLAMSRYLKEGWYLYQASQTLTKIYHSQMRSSAASVYIHFWKKIISSLPKIQSERPITGMRFTVINSISPSLWKVIWKIPKKISWFYWEKEKTSSWFICPATMESRPTVSFIFLIWMKLKEDIEKKRMTSWMSLYA